MHLLTHIKSVASSFFPKSNTFAKNPEAAANGDHQNGPTFINVIPPLKPAEFPRILPQHRYALADQGWTKVTFHDPVDELQSTSQALFQASNAFFDLPVSQKEKFRTKAGTEEGWNHVQGEKEFITLRTVEKTPPELKDAATAYWKAAGSFLDELLKRISESLDMPASALGVYSEPCATFGFDKTATMLRLFRYETPWDDETKTVAEGMSNFTA